MAVPTMEGRRLEGRGGGCLQTSTARAKPGRLVSAQTQLLTASPNSAEGEGPMGR